MIVLSHEKELMRSLKPIMSPEYLKDFPRILPEPTQVAGNLPAVEETCFNEQDIFSLGCVLAELFLEGQRLFDLSEVHPMLPASTACLSACIGCL